MREHFSRARATRFVLHNNPEYNGEKPAKPKSLHGKSSDSMTSKQATGMLGRPMICTLSWKEYHN